jgi:uncharacterized protein YdeI (BOF family)
MGEKMNDTLADFQTHFNNELLNLGEELKDGLITESTYMKEQMKLANDRMGSLEGELD